MPGGEATLPDSLGRSDGGLGRSDGGLGRSDGGHSAGPVGPCGPPSRGTGTRKRIGPTVRWSTWGAVAGLPPAPLPRPLAEPDVRFSPRPAMDTYRVGYQAADGVAMLPRYR